jgi:hypothetical protein
VLGLLVAGAGWFVVKWTVSPAVETQQRLTQDLGPRATGVDFSLDMIDWVFVIHLAPGYEAQAQAIACQIVAPDIAAIDPTARYEILSAKGQVLVEFAGLCT